MTNEAPTETIPRGPSPEASATPPETGGTPAAPEEQPKSTVETLFPDFIGDDGKLMNQPRPVTEAMPGEVLDPTPVLDKTPPTQPTTTPQYVDLNSLDGKLMKLKVDGVEIDVPAETVVKNYQLEAHLTQKGQRLADQEKILQEVLKEAVNRKPTGTPPAAGEPTAIPEDPNADPELVKIKAELQATRQELAQVSKATQHVRVQEGLKAIDQDIRTNIGADDFMVYAPKITEFAKSQCKDPANPTPEEKALFDTVGFYKTKYLEMKAKDMIAGKTPVPKAPPPAAPAAGAPPAKGPESRPAPNISVETGAGSPQIEQPHNSWNARYKAALQKATQTGDMHDWAEVSRLKHEPAGSR